MAKNEAKIESIKFRNERAYLIISLVWGFSYVSHLAIQFFYKDVLKIEPTRLLQIHSFIHIPWAIKPLFGLCTDLIPLFSYRRKSYLFICSFLIIFCYLTLSLFSNSPLQTTIILFIKNIGVAFISVVAEAMLIEQCQLEKDIEESSKDKVSYFQFAKHFGYLLSSYLGGIFVDIMNLRTIFFICAILPLFYILAAFLYVEVKDRKILDIQMSRDKESILRDTSVIAYCNSEEHNANLQDAPVGIKGTQGNQGGPNNVGTNYNTILQNQELPNQYSFNPHNQSNHAIAFIEPDAEELLKNLSVLIEEENHVKKIHFDSTLSDFWLFITRKQILVPIIFIIVFMSTPSYYDPYFYFLTNVIKLKGKVLGQLSFFGSIAMLIGIVFYKYYLKDCNFKVMITFGTIFSSLISLMSLLVILRINIKMGISDFWLLLFTSSFLSILAEFIMLPILSLTCMLCPKNLEGTIFSVFASAMNLGRILSNLNGSIVTGILSISSKSYEKRW